MINSKISSFTLALLFFAPCGAFVVNTRLPSEVNRLPRYPGTSSATTDTQQRLSGSALDLLGNSMILDFSVALFSLGGIAAWLYSQTASLAFAPLPAALVGAQETGTVLDQQITKFSTPHLGAAVYLYKISGATRVSMVKRSSYAPTKASWRTINISDNSYISALSKRTPFPSSTATDGTALGPSYMGSISGGSQVKPASYGPSKASWKSANNVEPSDSSYLSALSGGPKTATPSHTSAAHADTKEQGNSELATTTVAASYLGNISGGSAMKPASHAPYKGSKRTYSPYKVSWKTSKALDKMSDKSCLSALTDESIAIFQSHDSASVEAKKEPPTTAVTADTGASYMDTISGGRTGFVKPSSYAPNKASWKASNGAVTPVGSHYMDSISGGRKGAMKHASFAPTKANWRASNGAAKNDDSYLSVIATGGAPAVVNSYSKPTIDIIEAAPSTTKKMSYAPTKSSWLKDPVAV